MNEKVAKKIRKQNRTDRLAFIKRFDHEIKEMGFLKRMKLVMRILTAKKEKG